MPSEDSDDSETEEFDISGTMPDPPDGVDALIIRETNHESDVHFCNVWDTEWDEKKVGVKSQKKYADIFSEKLDWERSHHRWGSERVEDTDMWEIDLDSVFYVACAFVDDGADVTIDQEVWMAFINDLG